VGARSCSDVAALRSAARERGGPLPSIDVADALLDERRGLNQVCCSPQGFSSIPKEAGVEAFTLPSTYGPEVGLIDHLLRQAEGFVSPKASHPATQSRHGPQEVTWKHAGGRPRV
jgi:hypothetical protein